VACDPEAGTGIRILQYSYEGCRIRNLTRARRAVPHPVRLEELRRASQKQALRFELAEFTSDLARFFKSCAVVIGRCADASESDPTNCKLAFTVDPWKWEATPRSASVARYAGENQEECY
jgi:hypothetical protein